MCSWDTCTDICIDWAAAKFKQIKLFPCTIEHQNTTQNIHRAVYLIFYFDSLGFLFFNFLSASVLSRRVVQTGQELIKHSKKFIRSRLLRILSKQCCYLLILQGEITNSAVTFSYYKASYLSDYQCDIYVYLSTWWRTASNSAEYFQCDCINEAHLLILFYLSSTLSSTDCVPRLAQVRYCWAIMRFTPNRCKANTCVVACYKRPKIPIHFFLEQFCPCWHPEKGWIEAKNF